MQFMPSKTQTSPLILSYIFKMGVTGSVKLSWNNTPLSLTIRTCSTLRPVHTERHNVALTGGTFDLFDGHCDGQNGLHAHFPIDGVF